MKEQKSQKLRDKAARFNRVFSTHDGEKVLEDLKEEFDNDELFSDNPYRTNYNVGRRDAFIYIQQLIRYHENVRRLEE